ncbi:MAG: hypothetical protein WC449_04030 [Candidatus Paceibacterota bacterium]
MSKGAPLKLIFSGLLLFALIGLAFWGIVKVSAIHKEIKSVKGEVAQLKNKEISLKEKDLELKKYKTDFATIGNQFVDSRDPRNFLKFINDEEVNNSVDVRHSVASPPTGPLVLAMSCIGPWQNCLHFVYHLENAPWLIEVSDLSAQYNASNDQMSLNFKLAVMTK